jgi:predicted RNA-binding Zn-ribbon protein involved in translation (DUF1610 family)
MEVRNMSKTLYDVMEDLGIRICPACGNEYTDHPAISRKDNMTEICPRCGMKEALEDYLTEKLQNKENDNKYCIFEKRICRFANKEGDTFSCTAKSDYEMLCKKK